MITPLNRVAPELRETYAMIVSAYPDGVPENEYWAILSLLSEHMSIRALAQILAACTPRCYEVIYNDILGAQSPFVDVKPQLGAVGQVRQRLVEHGYEEWLKHDD